MSLNIWSSTGGLSEAVKSLGGEAGWSPQVTGQTLKGISTTGADSCCLLWWTKIPWNYESPHKLFLFRLLLSGTASQSWRTSLVHRDNSEAQCFKELRCFELHCLLEIANLYIFFSLLWQLMLCVGVTGHRVLRYCFACTVFWVLSWQWFWMCFVFKLEDQVCWLISLKWGGFIQSVDSLMRAKSDPLLREENSFCLVTIKLRHWLFSYLYIWIETLTFLVSDVLACG